MLNNHRTLNNFTVIDHNIEGGSWINLSYPGFKGRIQFCRIPDLTGMTDNLQWGYRLELKDFDVHVFYNEIMALQSEKIGRINSNFIAYIDECYITDFLHQYMTLKEFAEQSEHVKLNLMIMDGEIQATKDRVKQLQLERDEYAKENGF